MTRHIVIPDTQVKPGTDFGHLRWVGQYIADKRPDVVVHLGDHWDLPSLSSWDKGKMSAENARYVADVKAGNDAMQMLSEPIFERIEITKRSRRKQWKPRLVLLRGNHEDRLTRFVENDAVLEGAISLDDLKSPGWEVIDFLKVVEIDGIRYSHYFYNPMSGRPYAGQSMDTRLKTVGHSFSMGHQQTLLVGRREVGGGGVHRGLVAGACYLHDESYKGPQGNDHWRGILVKNEVRDGNYDLTEVSLNYLCERYGGTTLDEYKRKVGL